MCYPTSLTVGGIDDFLLQIPMLWKYTAPYQPEFAQLLDAFTNVQVRSQSFRIFGYTDNWSQINALLAHATSGNSGFYGVDWSGPPANDTMSIAGMSAAITALAASIGPYSGTFNSYNSSSSGSSPTPSSSTSHRRVSGGALAGVVCASIIVAALIVGILACIRNRRQRRRETDAFARRAVHSLSLQARVSLVRGYLYHLTWLEPSGWPYPFTPSKELDLQGPRALRSRVG